MTHVVTESCINCRFTDCVDVCPVDCFKKVQTFSLLTQRNAFCAVCIPEVRGSYLRRRDVPEGQESFIDLNAELSKEWETISKMEEKPDDADHWLTVKEKKHLWKDEIFTFNHKLFDTDLCKTTSSKIRIISLEKKLENCIGLNR